MEDKEEEVNELILELETALELKDIRSAVNAIRQLWEIKDERVVKVLVRALKNENPNVRYEAAWALGKIRDPKAVEPLIKLLGDKYEGVRNEAA